jgi:hypothetical protein
LAAAADNGCRFGHHCCWWTSPNSIKLEVDINKLLFYIYLMNQTKSFDGSNGKGMRKAAHPWGGVGLSNSCHWRAWRLHHHGDGVF